jgi:bifunctional UDP-N-acetylglucosamine pyrophosphorylase / glucosamine-1-phosphate N-acetyltransferase
MSRPDFAAIILAAGSGTRMKSSIPKVLHAVAGRPMIEHLLTALEPLAPAATVVVVGRQMEAVTRLVAPAMSVVQDPPLGTGDAVRTGLAELAAELSPHGPIEDVLVLFGDTPLLRTETMARLLDEQKASPASVLLAGMRPADPSPYGRLLATPDGRVLRIVEAADASPDELKIGLCWPGIMLIRARHAIELVSALDCNNAQREFYLTGIVGLATARALECRVIELPSDELIGVNTRGELAAAEALMQGRLRQAAMAAGVTLVAPDTVFLSADTRFGHDVVVEPNVFFGPGVSVGDGAWIRSFSHFDRAVVGANAIVGPFARLRPGAVLEEDVHIGNFVEVKEARLGAGVKASHLSYIGDASIGAGTNIGAGTITCNYDGVNKWRTTIGKGVFIGSDSVLVAPVTVGDGAYVAAGSVITRAVPDDALSIGRAHQVDKPRRAPVLRERLRSRN